MSVKNRIVWGWTIIVAGLATALALNAPSVLIVCGIACGFVRGSDLRQRLFAKHPMGLSFLVLAIVVVALLPVLHDSSHLLRLFLTVLGWLTVISLFVMFAYDDVMIIREDKGEHKAESITGANDGQR